jgi:homogentisate 1,2-dioxygenase
VSEYQSGFGNTFETEAEEGALPRNQNSPRKAPFGLFAEQINGTCFTVPAVRNRRTWMYRIAPTMT